MWAIYKEDNIDTAWNITRGWVGADDVFDLFYEWERKTATVPDGGVWRLVA